MKDTDMTLPQLHSKFPKLITSLNHLRQRCQLPEEIPIAPPEQAVSTRRPRAEDKQPEEFVLASPEQPVSSQRPKDIPIVSTEQPMSSKWPRAEDKERGLPSKKKNKLIVVAISKTAIHIKQDEGQSSGLRVCFTQPSCPNIPMGVIKPQPVPTSRELSELTDAIFVEDLNGTSNEDSTAKPPNVSIFLPSPLPPPITTVVTGEPGQLPSTERQSAKELSVAIRRNISQVINSRLLPYVQARIQRHIAATDMWKQAYEVELSKVRELQATNDGLRGQLAAKDAAKSEVHALARTEVQHELEEFKRSVTELEDFKRSVTAKEKAAEETHLQKLALVQTQLEETKRSPEASIKRLEEEASRLREALAAKESVVQALENAHQKEISNLKATCRMYKTSLDGERGINADLQARVLNLQNELSTCKYTQEQALQGQKSARAELLEVKKELRMLQVLHQDIDEGNAASAP
ncbi:hypothetical protein R1flu_024334 [Riccia fluitans]|uniref:Uncharacterized protein n=1 Tax=Riccia fluitans TaxID=41844 RepID=A0ABD1XUR2_9MARC